MKQIHWKALAGMLVFSLMLVYACGSDKYADARSLMTEQAKVSEAYVNGLEKAGSADDVAAVIDKYTDDMKTLIPRIKAFREKHPDLAFMSGKATAPKELETESKRLEEATAKIQAATMNVMKYMMDQKVQKAMQRMAKELSGLGA
jgi:hypothetical protein